MNTYIYVKPDGSIAGYGYLTQPEDIDRIQQIPGTTIVLNQMANLVEGEYYDFTENKVKTAPPKPSENHVFDYNIKQWVDPRTIADFRAEQWSKIKNQRDQYEFGGFTWDGSTFDSDLTSQSRIQGAVQLAQLALTQNQPFTIDWTLANNTTRTLGAEQMVQVGLAMGQHINNCHEIARGLRAQIDSATTREQVEQVTWPA